MHSVKLIKEMFTRNQGCSSVSAGDICSGCRLGSKQTQITFIEK